MQCSSEAALNPNAAFWEEQGLLESQTRPFPQNLHRPALYTQLALRYS